MMPDIPPEQREEWLRQVREKLAREEAEKNKAKGGAEPNGQDADHAAREEALRALRIDIGRLNDGSGPEAINAIVDRIAACNLDEIARERLLATIKAQTNISIRTLRRQFADSRKQAKTPPPTQTTPPGAQPSGGLGAPDLSDDALALTFTRAHADNLRHVALLGKWLLWTGDQWQFEDTLKAFDLAGLICRQASALCSPKQQKLARDVASAKTVAAVERLAKADRRHATTPNQWDPDIWIFNQPG
jgi:D5 N terminal like